MIQVEHLVCGCHSGERNDIEEMLLRAAEYTRAVVELEVKSKNLRGLDPDQLRKEIKEANTNCFVSLNGFIVYAERVNRICRKHDRTQVYWGE